MPPIIALALVLCSAPLPTLDAASLPAYRDLIRPSSADLSFLKIPWRTSLMEAVKEAERDHKPILLWAMNGHPLGCV